MAILVGAMLLVMGGFDPWVAYRALYFGAFGNTYNTLATVMKSVPLLLVALGLTFAFKNKFWNIGGEGQLYMGAVAATWVALAVDLPMALHLPLTIAAGFLGGSMWSGIAGLLKVKFRVNEVITTLMMNFIALYWVSYLVRGPMQGSETAGYPESAPFPLSAQLPALIQGSPLQAGIIMALVCVLVVYVIFNRTTLGYAVRAVGANPEAANYAGINVAKTIFVSAIISGGLCGLAGVNEAAGVQFHLIDNLSPGYGYTAIVVALLGRLDVLGVVLASILFGALISGATTMQQAVGVSAALIQNIQALILVFMLTSDSLTYWFSKFMRSGTKDGNPWWNRF
jgi:ABC-type uncharacterized transport system permease subunit